MTDPVQPQDDLPPDTPWYARIAIDNIREAWKLASVWWPALCAALMEVYAEDKEQIDAFINQYVPEKYKAHLLAGAFLVTIIARVVKQKSQGAK